MKLGCCLPGGFSPADLLAAGYDYVEMNAQAVTAMSPAERRALRAGGAVLACNCLLPGTCRIAAGGPVLTDTAVRTFDALAEAGCPLVAFGSGAARTRPEGDAAYDAKLEDFVRLLDRLGAERGIRIAVEPLDHRECNVFNRVDETAAYCRRLGLANVRTLADLYHMAREGETADSLEAAADMLIHVHAANLEDRAVPIVPDTHVTEGIRRLVRIGYTGNVSIEGSFRDAASELRPAARAMKDLIRRALAEAGRPEA